VRLTIFVDGRRFHLNGHDLFFFFGGNLIDLCDVLVSNLLTIILQVFQVILCDLAGFLHRFQFIVGITADGADRNLGFFTHLGDAFR